jgi:hypothetical protein
MGKLYELLAVDGDAQSVAAKVINEAVNTFRTKAEHFRGQVAAKSYLDDSKQALNSTSQKELVTTVDDKLEFVAEKVSRHYDILLQKEMANAEATADILLPDGTLFMAGVPTMFLLHMEARLKAIREMVISIPTLDPSMIWVEDATQKNVFRSEPVKTVSTEKSVQYKVLYDATDKHPAQIEKWSVDVPVAYTLTTQFSGMWTVSHKSDVLDRIDTLMQSVKQARMRANTVEVPKASIGDALFRFILGTR